MIDRSEVVKMAALSKLELGEEEIAHHQDTLGQILDYIKTLDDVDTTGVQPTIHPIHLELLLREDVVDGVLSREDVLKNAPQSQNGKFAVPKMIGDT